MRQAAAEQGKGGYTQLVCDTGNLLQRRRAVAALKAAVVQGGQAEALGEFFLREALALRASRMWLPMTLKETYMNNTSLYI